MAASWTGCRFVSVANLKGGVGKSTTSMMLADTLSHFHGVDVLLVDLDPQASASRMILSDAGHVQADRARRTFTHLLHDLTAAEKTAPPSSIAPYLVSDASSLKEGKQAGRLDICPSTPELWFEETAFNHRHYSLQDPTHPRQALTRRLESVMAGADGRWQAVVFDCPPSFSTTTQAALRLSDVVVSPIIPDTLSLWGLISFRKFGLWDTLQLDFGPDRHRVLFTRHDEHDADGKTVMTYVDDAGFQCFDTRIPQTSQAHKWTLRSAPPPRGRRSFAAKYGPVRDKVKTLGNELHDLLASAGGRSVS